MSRIRVSQKHGVNPTIPICFFCSKEKNEIVLLGKLPDDAKAPMYTFVNYEPCDNCKKLMEQGVTLIEVVDKPLVKNQAPIQENHYPTGRWCIIQETAAKEVFNTNEKKILIDPTIMDNILPDN